MSMQNSTDWVNKLLSGFVADDKLARITSDFASYRDVPLAQLGVDSMAIMGLVLNLENVFGLQIDYAAFEVSALRTLSTIEHYLAGSGVDVERTGSGS